MWRAGAVLSVVAMAGWAWGEEPAKAPGAATREVVRSGSWSMTLPLGLPAFAAKMTGRAR